MKYPQMTLACSIASVDTRAKLSTTLQAKHRLLNVQTGSRQAHECKHHQTHSVYIYIILIHTLGTVQAISL